MGKTEVWKPVIGYEGFYEVSNNGRVRSIDRVVFQQGRIQKYKGAIMSQYLRNNGYYSVRLSIGNKKKTFSVHRLVAKAFIPNNNNYPCINHKDEVKTNNNVENLEWCTIKYNVNYGTAILRKSLKMGKKIAQYDSNGKLIGTFYSINEAERKNNIKIGNSILFNNHTAGGYFWRLFESTPPICIDVHFSKNHSRRVCQYSKDLELIAIYESGRKASDKTGFKHENILACCRGKQKSCGGFIWAFDGRKPSRMTPRINQKSVIMLSIDERILMEFESISSASKYLGGNKSAGIKQCLYGKNNTAYGYKWRYA